MIDIQPVGQNRRGSSTVRASLIVLIGTLALAGCAAPVQQLGAYPRTDAYPQERGVVCAVKYAMRQNYWNAQAAQRDGAVVIFAGECPAEPNSEGFSG